MTSYFAHLENQFEKDRFSENVKSLYVVQKYLSTSAFTTLMKQMGVDPEELSKYSALCEPETRNPLQDF